MPTFAVVIRSFKASKDLHHRLLSSVGFCGIHLLHIPDSVAGIGSDVDARYETEVGDWSFKCMHEYGAVWHQSGCLGVSVSSLISYRALLSKNLARSFGDRRSKGSTVHPSHIRISLPQTKRYAEDHRFVVRQRHCLDTRFVIICSTTSLRSLKELLR